MSTTPEILRFRARGAAMVPNFDALLHPTHPVTCYVGRKYVEKKPGKWGFEPTGETDEVPYRAEYVKACRDDLNLYAADAETALACGVEFDPTFGAKAPEKAPEKAPAPPADKPADKPAAKAAEKG